MKWKLIFWLGVLSIPANFVYLFITTGSIVNPVASSAITAFLLVPYYGYAYRRAILAQIVWKVTIVVQFVLLAVVTIFTLISQFFYVSGGGEWYGGMLLLLVPIALFGALLVAPYRYAFKATKLWV